MKKANFIHLHLHTEYSLLDGLTRIKEVVKRAKDWGMPALAITDHGAMYGVIKFYNACQEAGIKPIIGCEIYMAHRSRFDKQPKIDADQYHLVLLAKNQVGYQNLMRLVTRAYLEGFYYKPRADLELLQEHQKGLIACSACIEGEIPSLIIADKYEEAKQRAGLLAEIFAKDFYLEIQHHPRLKKQNKANKGLIQLSKELGIPLVATNDVHYLSPEDAEAQDVLLAIQTQKTIDTPNRLTMIDSPDFYFRSPQEMERAFVDYPQAITNTLEIAEKCNLKIPLGKKVYPRFPLPAGETAESYLRKLVWENAPKRYPKLTPEIKKRIEYELEIITKMGYAEYFLIVQDVVNWAKRQGIRVGPGRGSAAGCVVSYVLRITSIDPLAHNLPFERFLNPERRSTPDIDIDFSDIRRDEVIEYVKQKYGEDRVAQIITFGTMEARLAVRDVARALGHPYSFGDRIAKMIPARPGHKITLKKALEQNPQLAQLYQEEKEVRRVLDLAMKLEGVARHASTHAAGVVITDKPLWHYTPLQRETKGERITTQYDMYDLDLNSSDNAIGLLKMDFLALRNLTILEKARDYIKATKGVQIDISEIPLDDAKVYQMIARGETTGVFQLESLGMRKLAQKLKPTKFSDLAAMVALFRPGPMEWIDEFVAGKKNPKKVHYPHPDLKPILEETYGIAVYQEQVMQIAHLMAGYTLGEADILRRAIGKKKIELMQKEKTRFFKRAKKRGYKEATIKQVWAMMERFAGYGFNKAHSVSYAMIAYQTAWMKANYPVEFMAALLTAEAGSGGQDKEAKIALAVEECRRMGILVLPPDINQSQTGFTIEKNPHSLDGLAIRFGLSAIKNVGAAAIEEILRVRQEGGDFVSLTDFCCRVSSQKVNRKVLESLIKAGAMDRFGKRSALLASLDKIRQQAEEQRKKAALGQTSLFEIDNPGPTANPKKDDLIEMEEFTPEELLQLEKQMLGLYLSKNPLGEQLARWKKLRSHTLQQLEEEAGSRVAIVGVVERVKTVTTRNGNQKMAFVTISDETGTVEVVVFPKLYQKKVNLLAENQIVWIQGRVEEKTEEERIVVLAEELVEPSKAKQSNPTSVFEIHLPGNLKPDKLNQLKKILEQYPGKQPVVLIFPDGRRLTTKITVTPGGELEIAIKKLLW